MDNNDERDYAEEMENLRILHTGDGEGECRIPDCKCKPVYRHLTPEESERYKDGITVEPFVYDPNVSTAELIAQAEAQLTNRQ